MYPYLRLASVMMTERAKPRLALFDTHAMAMRCLPNDLDGFFEMNNGRILTLYDLGRFALSVRIGLWDVLRREGWGLVVAGASVRYRARITGLQRFGLQTRLLGWDEKFFYIEQAMWRGETCCNHALLRTGITKSGRLAPVVDVARAMGHAGQSPALPDWVAGWVGGDQARPWPPMQDGASSP